MSSQSGISGLLSIDQDPIGSFYNPKPAYPGINYGDITDDVDRFFFNFSNTGNKWYRVELQHPNGTIFDLTIETWDYTITFPVNDFDEEDRYSVGIINNTTKSVKIAVYGRDGIGNFSLLLQEIPTVNGLFETSAIPLQFGDNDIPLPVAGISIFANYSFGEAGWYKATINQINQSRNTLEWEVLDGEMYRGRPLVFGSGSLTEETVFRVTERTNITFSITNHGLNDMINITFSLLPIDTPSGYDFESAVEVLLGTTELEKQYKSLPYLSYFAPEGGRWYEISVTYPETQYPWFISEVDDPRPAYWVLESVSGENNTFTLTIQGLENDKIYIVLQGDTGKITVEVVEIDPIAMITTAHFSSEMGKGDHFVWETIESVVAGNRNEPTDGIFRAGAQTELYIEQDQLVDEVNYFEYRYGLRSLRSWVDMFNLLVDSTQEPLSFLPIFLQPTTYSFENGSEVEWVNLLKTHYLRDFSFWIPGLFDDLFDISLTTSEVLIWSSFEKDNGNSIFKTSLTYDRSSGLLIEYQRIIKTGSGSWNYTIVLISPLPHMTTMNAFPISLASNVIFITIVTIPIVSRKLRKIELIFD